tara:strand:- start:2796 stop:3347 length:552 start_codon:yes stop_codon:yes gene_type:complete
MDYTGMYNRGMGIPRQQTPIGGSQLFGESDSPNQPMPCACTGDLAEMDVWTTASNPRQHHRRCQRRATDIIQNSPEVITGECNGIGFGGGMGATKRGYAGTGGEVGGGTLKILGGGKKPCYCFEKGTENRRLCNYFAVDTFSWKCKQCCKRFEGDWTEQPPSDDPTVVKAVSNQYGLPIYSQR